MKSVTVTASRTYEVQIGAGLMQNVGAKTAGLVSGRTAAVVADDTVFGLYGETVIRSLEKAGFSVCRFVFPHG